MARYNFTSDLSAKGIKKLRQELQNYKTNILQHKIDLFARMLSEIGVASAQIRIADLDAIFTGELIASIHSLYGGSSKGTAIFYVVADSKHAAFVEFGTGQLGMEGPYPYPFPIGMDWQYNTGKTIFEIGPGQYGWFYPAEDGTWKFTQGMPARPFMHEAFIDIYAKVERIAKEVFG